jgi:calcineurin-like phosphoesterase family protein
MTVFFTADTHFWHRAIIEHCKRPYGNVEQMNECMVALWNGRVGASDLVYHLGDFANWKYEQAMDILPRLNGRIILITGNHEENSRGMRAAFPLLTPWLAMKIGGYRVLLIHRPLSQLSRELDPRYAAQGFSKNVGEEYAFALCGHVHDRWTWSGRNFNVGVDVHNFTPISLEEIVAELDKTYNR